MLISKKEKGARWKAIADRMKQGKGVTKLNQQEAIEYLKSSNPPPQSI